MIRIAFFIDGFNLYYSLTANTKNQYAHCKWLDIRRLAGFFINPKRERIEHLLYFTSFEKWNPGKVARHKVFIRTLINSGIRVVLGEFKTQDRWCKNCRTSVPHHVEKQTDVNIAIELFRAAHNDLFDKAIVLSGDSDLVPAILAVRQEFPDKRVGVLLPIQARALSIVNAADFHMKIKEKHLKSAGLPNPLPLHDGTLLHKPAGW